MNQHPSRREKFRLRNDRWVWVLGLPFLLIAILTGYLSFSTVGDVVASLGEKPVPPNLQEPPPLPAISPQKYLDISSPLQPENGPPPYPWDEQSPVTLLFLGVDNHDWEKGNAPPDTDAIILATIDSQQRTAGMLSIPRDLWVNIPGYGYNKLNQAYKLGEINQVPGGGAGLAMDTVEALFDISIPYYALIDFNAFVSLVDDIGGVKINIPEEININLLGDHKTRTLQPGVQTLPGDFALAYVRKRDNADSDFDQAMRQQQVILGIRRRLINFELIPHLIEKAPVLYDEIASGFKTNLSLRQVVQFSWLTTQIPAENIHREIIGPDQMDFALSYDGGSILQPVPEEILKLRDTFFSTVPPESPAAVLGMDPDGRVIEENAAISLHNGTYTAGLAAQTMDYLQTQNINVVSISNADHFFPQTTIVDYTGKPFTIEYLAQILHVPPGKIQQQFDPYSDVDILVTLGEDWATTMEIP